MASTSLVFIAGAVFSSVLAACTFYLPPTPDRETAEARSEADTTLIETSWKLVQMDSTEVGRPYTLMFGAAGQVSGQADCNRYFGSYTLEDDGGVAFGRLGMTRMLCPEGSSDSRYVALLEAAARAEIEGERLVLVTGDGVQLFFAPEPMPEGHRDAVISTPETTDFRASGNEPFWSLEIREAEGMTFSRPGEDGIVEIVFPYASPSLGIETGERFFHAETEAHELQAIFAPKPCEDDMSGRGFEFIATVTLDGENLFGCAEALN